MTYSNDNDASQTDLLSLSETARRHGVSKSGLSVAVHEDRPIRDMNLHRYAVRDDNGKLLGFDFPDWYTFPDADDDSSETEKSGDRSSRTGKSNRYSDRLDTLNDSSQPQPEEKPAIRAQDGEELTTKVQNATTANKERAGGEKESNKLPWALGALGLSIGVAVLRRSNE